MQYSTGQHDAFNHTAYLLLCYLQDPESVGQDARGIFLKKNFFTLIKVQLFGGKEVS